MRASHSATFLRTVRGLYNNNGSMSSSLSLRGGSPAACTRVYVEWYGYIYNVLYIWSSSNELLVDGVVGAQWYDVCRRRESCMYIMRIYVQICLYNSWPNYAKQSQYLNEQTQVSTLLGRLVTANASAGNAMNLNNLCSNTS